MKTITNITEFWAQVTSITKKHAGEKDATIQISTFGLFSSSFGDSLVKNYFELLSTLRYSNIQIAVGMSKYTPCKIGCLDCYNKYCLSVKRTNSFLAKYPTLKIAMVYDTHMKLFMVKSKAGCDYIVGGINFGDSQWNDSAVVLSGENKPLAELFEFVFLKAKRFDFIPQLAPPEDVPKYGLINFGKYKGNTWAEIKKINPGYIDWCRKENINMEL